MLMLGDNSKAPALGNFYYSPVRLRPVIEPAYFADAQQPRSRSKHESKLDLSLDVRPTSRHGPIASDSNVELDVNNFNKLTEDQSPFANVDEEDSDSETETKKSHHKNKKNKNKKSKNDSTFEHLCSKLRVSIVLAILGVIILVVCCCALWLRRRIVACFKKCWPFGRKKQSKKNLFDVEDGSSYQQSRKSPSRNSSKRKSNPKMIDTGVQDSGTSVTPAQEGKSAGCSPFCKKKKKKTGKKRRK